jgi:hypothetical protein
VVDAADQPQSDVLSESPSAITTIFSVAELFQAGFDAKDA